MILSHPPPYTIHDIIWHHAAYEHVARHLASHSEMVSWFPKNFGVSARVDQWLATPPHILYWRSIQAQIHKLKVAQDHQWCTLLTTIQVFVCILLFLYCYFLGEVRYPNSKTIMKCSQISQEVYIRTLINYKHSINTSHYCYDGTLHNSKAMNLTN
jgi:hypothetical protein